MLNTAAEIEKLIENLKTELEELKSRIVVDDECMSHLYEIYKFAFVSWYDPENEEHKKWGQQLWPHIRAINDKLKFRK
jgi:hypothetical protein